jgi:FixJ family two-component response regulator
MRMNHAPVVAVVDDDQSMRHSMNIFLRSLGYRSDTFVSAEEFLESGRLRDASCVISDVRMPGMNGLELQKRLVSIGCEIPVIFITAFADNKVREDALKAGAIGFLHKPFREEKLIACLEQALGHV